MRLAMLATSAAMLVACAPITATTGCARAAPGSCADLADVEILDRTTGDRLPVYWHDGQRWIAGQPGHRYAVSVRNETSGRILGVVSVDGINAVSGETASWNQRGYVFGPNESFDILGWRKSQQRVADFVFTSIDESYAARTGRPDEIGVIGVALFREAVHAEPAVTDGPIPPSAAVASARSAQPSAAGPASPSAAAKADQETEARQRLGTGHGQSEASWVSLTSFERAQQHPDQVVTIRYDRRERLVALGVIPGSAGPRPFPESADSGFVPDPPSRR